MKNYFAPFILSTSLAVASCAHNPEVSIDDINSAGKVKSVEEIRARCKITTEAVVANDGRIIKLAEAGM